MILYLQDFRQYPTCIIDHQSKNKSFVRLSSIYRLMGIKNHAFLLALVNPSLQGVDPYDPNLTIEQQAAIAIECKINPWYFFREVARAPANVGDMVTMFEANRANIAVLWSFFNHILFILIQPRQTGKSFTIDTLMALLLNILCRNTQINLLTKDDTLRRETITRLKEIMEELPGYLKQRTKADSDNTEEITIKSLGNVYKSHVPQASKKRAYNSGRGQSTPIVHIDEPPFQPNISISLPALFAASGAVIDKAKISGEPYGFILTTTAGKKDDEDGKFIFNEIVSKAADWTEKFLDCKDEIELRDMVMKSSRGELMIHGSFNHRQLGKSDDWLREKIMTSKARGQDADRDYFNIWTSGTQTNPIPTDILERMRKSVREPDYIGVIQGYNYITRWFVKEHEIKNVMRENKVLMCLDPSEASGGDDIGMVLINCTDLSVIGTGIYNETNLFRFSEWIANFLIENENVILVIERKSMGAMILDHLLIILPSKGIDPFTRIFNRVVQEAEENKEAFMDAKIPFTRRKYDVYTKHKRSFGYPTSGTGDYSRDQLYSTTLLTAVKRTADKMHDKTLVDQISSIEVRNGRLDHAAGAHDDMVIAYLLGNWFLTQGKNLSFYGIEASRIANDLIERIKNATPEERYKIIEQQNIRRRIDEIYKALTEKTDEFVISKLEHELKVLDMKLVLRENEVYSMDELLKRAKDARKNRRFIKQPTHG